MTATRHRRLFAVAFLLAGLLSHQCPLARAGENIAIDTGAGRFDFQDSPEYTGKRIPVWYFKPEAYTHDTLIVFVPGVGHSNAGMAGTAAALLQQSLASGH